MPPAPDWFQYADAVDALLALLLGAVIGFALTGLQGVLDRRRRRESLASALLVELRTLEHALTLRYENPRAGEAGGRVLTPVFDKFSGDLLLFRKECLYRILHFYGFVGDVNMHIANVQNRLDHSKSPADGNHYVQLKSQFALESIAEAKAALEAQGGILPARIPSHGKSVDRLPPAPAKSFVNYPSAGDA